MSRGESRDLAVALQAVNTARSILDRTRTRRSTPQVAATLEQWRLLTALEGYDAALTSHGHPMPYKMRRELAMYRAMFTPRRQR